ncbi:hypothetical protein H5410_031504 [Solanum commersonii]|uniref:Uncharacterized protein n=1 Tax=Solanum commersonii TaxID=4109 RepID=A0A9J5YMK1_SOLCO|nr:hypothetical protein H5410_031504 [Solanum commersonii]
MKKIRTREGKKKTIRRDFTKGKKNKEGPNKNKPNQVWNKMGIIATNKFEALNAIEGPPIQLASALRELSKEKLKNMQETKEDKNMEENIQHVCRAGDLSPRHMNSLKKGIKKSKEIIPLQSKTRINTYKSFECLIDLNRRHHYKYIAILEPFRDLSELEQYQRKVGHKNALVNRAGKYRFFGIKIIKCSMDERFDLWKDLEYVAEETTSSFNVILKGEEKLGGVDFTQSKEN